MQVAAFSCVLQNSIIHHCASSIDSSNFFSSSNFPFSSMLVSICVFILLIFFILSFFPFNLSFIAYIDNSTPLLLPNPSRGFTCFYFVACFSPSINSSKGISLILTPSKATITGFENYDLLINNLITVLPHACCGPSFFNDSYICFFLVISIFQSFTDPHDKLSLSFPHI